MIWKHQQLLQLAISNNFMKKAYTLIEILIVTTIIVLLTAVAVVSYSTFLKQSRDAKRKSDLEQVRAALEMFRSNSTTNDYPTTGLSELTSPVVYIQSVPADPKNPTYTYYYSGSASNYTLGAYLETTASTCPETISCTVGNCNYCVGPYGQK